MPRTMPLLCLLVLTGGCATQHAAERERDPDPLEPVNRVIYRFNDIADTFVLRPVARAYRNITPNFIRTGVNNFYDNILYPVDIVNAFLQGKFRQGFSDTGRFVANTTLGLAGVLDPATEMGLKRNNEDFGQTLGVWGVPEGPYLVVPLLGPRTFRSGAGNLVDIQYAPQFWIFSSSVQTKVNLFWYVHERSTLLDIDREVERAFDPYAFIRDAYLQNRLFLVHDGNPPIEDDFLDEEGFEEFDE